MAIRAHKTDFSSMVFGDIIFSLLFFGGAGPTLRITSSLVGQAPPYETYLVGQAPPYALQAGPTLRNRVGWGLPHRKSEPRIPACVLKFLNSSILNGMMGDKRHILM